MLSPAQHWDADDLPIRWQWRKRSHRGSRYLLADTLMGAGVVKVPHVGFNDASQVLFTEEREMIQALAADTAQEAFDDGVRAWSVVRRT